MNKFRFILGSFKNFLKFNPKKLALIYVLTVLLALSQGISYVLLIPLLQLLELKNQGQTNLIQDFFYRFADIFNFDLSIEILLSLYVIVLSILFFVNTRRNLIQINYQNKYSGYLRNQIYRRVIFSDWKTLSQTSKHSHLHILTSEVPKVTHFYFYLLNSSTKAILLSIHLGLAFLVSFKLTIIVCISGLLQFLILSRYLRKSFKIGKQSRLTFKKVLKFIDDFWITIKPAKIHNTEKFYYDSFSKADQQFVDTQIQELTNSEKPQFLYKMMGLVNLVIVIYIANKFFFTPISSLIVLILLFSKILPLFMTTFSDINQLFLNAVSVWNIKNMKYDKNNLNTIETKANEITLKNNIKIENVSFSYDNNKQVFKNLNLTIRANSITGILGQSGKGKTTLIDLISGLLIPDSGTIKFDDFEITKQNSFLIRRNIGYLPQESLFIDGTIRENLVWDTHFEISDSDIEFILNEVNAFGILANKNLTLNSEILNYKYSFSGGELQRLALARVLLRKPKLLILDEATSALDEKNEDTIVDLMKDLKIETTIVFVTHKKRLIEQFDEIIDLEKV